ncbi:MAG: CsbD family protein [Thermoanaerobaculia bacterium]
MNWVQIESNWKRMKGHFQQKWGELKDDDLEGGAGVRERLIAALQERYGMSADEAEGAVDEFARSI